MSSGAGRGRGWLNLPKNSEPARPGGLANTVPNNASPNQQPKMECKELINRIQEMNLNDDGIMFNRKMHYVQEYWLKECNNKEDVEYSFEQLYTACLHDTELASKLVCLMASRTFVTQKIHECNLRNQFLTHLQRDFENGNELQTTAPAMFRNCVHMIGEFYNKARLSNGEPYKFLATPFIACLELLLNSQSVQDYILFANQLYKNGSTLKGVMPEELAKLGIQIRTILVNETQLGKDAKLWLLLTLDLFNVRFGVLQAEVYKYYESQLGSVMVNFQRPHDALSIQTVHTSKILDSYQSNVNVLQISTSPTEPPQNEIQASYAEYNGIQQNHNFPKDVPSNNKEKPGRPILGSGARFIKNKGNEESSSWNNKNSSGRTHSKKHPPNLKSNKGWEHDDRFDTDYN